MVKTFPCTKCGCCCRRVDVAVNLFNAKSEWMKDGDYPIYFPYNWDETGKCEMLKKNNTCQVYKNRPLICDVEKMANYLTIPKKLFFEQNIEACNKLMDEDNIPEKYKIKQ